MAFALIIRVFAILNVDSVDESISHMHHSGASLSVVFDSFAVGESVSFECTYISEELVEFRV